MVRTRADNPARKAVAAKAPRKVVSAPSHGSAAGSSSPGSSGGKYGGGNPVCVRPTPEWQKGISGFLAPRDKTVESVENNNEVNKSSSEDIGSTGACASSSDQDEVPSSMEEVASSMEGVASSMDDITSSPVKNGIIDSDED